MDVKTASRLFFAVTMLAMGLIGLIGGDLAPIFRPVPQTMAGRDILAYLSAFIALACGLGLLLRRTVALAAFVLLIFLLVWTAAFKAPFIVRAPLVEVGYQSAGENLVLIAAAWILFDRYAGDLKQPISRALAEVNAVRIAYVLYGLALIAFGLSHFFYLKLTAPLVPAWLPGPVFWAYLTGSVYLITGVMVLTGFAASLGTAIAALQITSITLLVWGPMVFTGDLTAMHWQETLESWALTASSWVIAAFFHGHRSENQRSLNDR